MPDLATLTTRAVDLGLARLPCWHCDGRPRVHVLDDPCKACNGTGQDRTPGGVLMAVSVAVVAAKDVIDVNMLDCGIVVGVGVACRVIRCEHDGTPEGNLRRAHGLDRHKEACRWTVTTGRRHVQWQATDSTVCTGTTVTRAAGATTLRCQRTTRKTTMPKGEWSGSRKWDKRDGKKRRDEPAQDELEVEVCDGCGRFICHVTGVTGDVCRGGCADVNCSEE